MKKIIIWNCYSVNKKMKCKNIRSIKVNLSGRQFLKEEKILLVPCGRCVACRLNNVRDWAVRIYHEASMYDNNSFITLTYSDENLPSDNSLNKKHLQDFFKRLRYYLNDNKIRYYAVGEYGDSFGRPHYHAIIFGLSPTEAKEALNKAWTYGFNMSGDVNIQSINYVAKYCMKKKYGNDSIDYKKKGIIPEFSLCSLGIGQRWCDKNKDWIRYHKFVYFGNKKMAVPRYYLKRCFSFEELHDELINRQLEKWDDWEQSHRDNPDFEKFLFESLKQSWYNFYAKQSVTKRK